MRGRHIDRSARQSRSTHHGPDRRLISAAVAAVISLLLFTNGLGTWSFWQSEVTVPGGTITSGSVSLTEKTLEVQLVSRQPRPTGGLTYRTYASTASCPYTAPYLDCRIVTSTLSAERLIPGDTLRVVQVIELSGQGEHLKGDLTIHARKVLDPNVQATDFARAAVVSMVVTKPDPGAQPLSGLTQTIPVSRGQVETFGLYTAVVTVVTPPTPPAVFGGTRWDRRAQGETLNLGDLTANFTQKNPQTP